MIHCNNLSITAGDFRLEGISLEVPAGAYGVLMGKTGSGKTTLLEAICGLRTIDQGTLRLGDREATRLRPGERNIGYVPQEGALFPRMTVGDNLAFAMTIARRSKIEAAARTKELAERLSVSHLLDRPAVGLSGGEQQRIALGRALAARPAVLLLDEPLAALDEATREQMVGLLRQVQQETATTVLHVTHSRQEAGRLADVLFELQAGQVYRQNGEWGGTAGPNSTTK